MASSADAPGQVGLFANYVTVTKAVFILKPHCPPPMCPGYTVGSPSFKSVGRGGSYSKISIDLEIVYITPTYIPLPTIQFYNHIQFQGRSGSVFEQLF